MKFFEGKERGIRNTCGKKKKNIDGKKVVTEMVKVET